MFLQLPMQLLDSVPGQLVRVHQIEQLGMSRNVFQIVAQNNLAVLDGCEGAIDPTRTTGRPERTPRVTVVGAVEAPVRCRG